MPEVSVIIPAYNSERYIEEALESALAQTFPGIEIIVVDDGSTDGTASILKKYEGRIRYFFQENRGLAAARNSGIKLASGSYLAFLDADDLFLPEKIALQKNFLDAHPEAAMVFSDFEYFGGSLLRHPIPDSFKRGEGDPFIDLFLFNCIAIPTILTRKESFDEIGLFDEELMAVEDYDFYLRLARKKRIGFIDRVLARVRLHPENMSRDAELMCEYELRVMDKAIQRNPELRKDHYSLIKEKTSIIFFESGYKLFLAHEMEKARGKFIMAMKNNPLRFKPFIYFFSSFMSPGAIRMTRKVKRLFAGRGW
ncbi:MAG: glycosyltransferase [Acidobacteriota bacterium]